ncbi:MAG: hypothetical protein BWY81_00019 [Firmicutes bacterium ADurb.Bin467]|nr:MAG: hypothetical protein BWY81_00019 [Firmicutes bacterium ADurb.Bin467]
MTVRKPSSAPENSTIDPTERSTQPVDRQKNMPIERMTRYEFCMKMLLTFIGLNRLPPVVMPKKMTTRTSAITSPYLPTERFFSLLMLLSSPLP